MLKRIYPEAGPRKSIGMYNLWMHAPEDREDVPDYLLLLMEKDATSSDLLPVGEDQGPGLFHGWREVDNSDLVQDYRWMFFIALSEDTCWTS